MDTKRFAALFVNREIHRGMQCRNIAGFLRRRCINYPFCPICFLKEYHSIRLHNAAFGSAVSMVWKKDDTLPPVTILHQIGTAAGDI